MCLPGIKQYVVDFLLLGFFSCLVYWSVVFFCLFFVFVFDATRKRVYCRLRKRVTLISWEAEHTEQQIGRALYMQKNILSAYYIRVAR